MNRFALLAVLFVITLGASMGAQAALPYAPEFSWTAPTLNVDGSTVPATGTLALKEYRFYCAQPPAVPSKTTTPTKVVLVPIQAWTAPAGTFATGNWSCGLTAVNNNTVAAGNESVLTNPINFTIAAPVPLPPSVLTVQ